MLANLSKNDKGELLLELAGNYFNEVTENLLNLKKKYELGDRDGLEMIAHKIKGSGYTIGAFSFARIAEKIEELARNGEINCINEYFDELNDSFKESCGLLQNYLAELGKVIEMI